MFSFSNIYAVTASNTHSFYAELLRDAIRQKWSNVAENKNATQRIELIKTDSIGLQTMLNRENLSLPFALESEGYVLIVSPTHIRIAANENAGLFYGVQTLIQLIKANAAASTIPCLVIYDRPDIPMRGWQDDISRGPIPTLDFLKEQIRTLASYKLNTFTLYTEHVFKLQKHPGIAPADGITAEEIAELDAYAKQYHVELIGNFQSFGHFKNILRTKGYETLAENEHTLSPANEETYRFLADVFSEIAPAYSSPYFHINCDEVTLGNGNAKAMIDSLGVEGVYAYHINRIHALLKSYGKRIMIWGDFAAKHPQVLKLLPKDIILVSWGYAAMEQMDSDIVPLANKGFDLMVAPGVSCWSRTYPDLQRAVANIYNYLRDGSKYHARGFINTTWDDNGNNLFRNNWYALVWGAECGWNVPANEPLKLSEQHRSERQAAFNRSYNKLYYETNKDIAALLLGISGLHYGAVNNSLTDAAIWHPLLPDDLLTSQNYEHDNMQLRNSIDSLMNECNQLKIHFGNKTNEFDLLPLALRHARLVANKNLLGIQLKEYIAGNNGRTEKTFVNELTALADTMLQLKSLFAECWKKENRSWWLDTVLAAYDSFSSNINKLQGTCIIRASNKLVGGKREIRLQSAFNNLPVYYTLNGSVPTAQSSRYTQPLYTDTAVVITARVIHNGYEYPVQRDSFIFHRGIGALHKLNTAWNNSNPVYAARGELALLDGRRGSPDNFNDNRWQAYLGCDIDIELDLQQPQKLTKLTMGFGQLMPYGILFPKQIEVYHSDNGIQYSHVNTTVNNINPNNKQRQTNDFTVPLNGITARYLKVVARNAGLLPEWHYAKGNPSWLTADEIIIE